MVFLLIAITKIQVKTDARTVDTGDLHRVVLDKRSSARFLEGGRFRRDGEEQDSEETDYTQKETGSGRLIHPCFNTTKNHSITTSYGEKVLCVVPSEETLMKKLEAAGGYNRWLKPFDIIYNNNKPYLSRVNTKQCGH